MDSNIISAWKGHEQFAEKLVIKLKPKVIVDLGVDYGFSTIAFSIPNLGQTVYGIDWFRGDDQTGYRNTYDICLSNIEKSGSTNILIIKNDLCDVVKTWDKPIDILHIDAEHSYDFTKKCFELWAPFVKENGIVLFHDTCSFAGTIGRYFNELIGYKYNFTHSHGLGVWSASPLTTIDL